LGSSFSSLLILRLPFSVIMSSRLFLLALPFLAVPEYIHALCLPENQKPMSFSWSLTGFELKQ
jgi:hypothetical protein